MTRTCCHSIIPIAKDLAELLPLTGLFDNAKPLFLPIPAPVFVILVTLSNEILAPC